MSDAKAVPAVQASRPESRRTEKIGSVVSNQDAEDHCGRGGDAQDPPKVQARNQAQQENSMPMMSRTQPASATWLGIRESRPAEQIEAVDVGRGHSPVLSAACRRSSAGPLLK